MSKFEIHHYTSTAYVDPQKEEVILAAWGTVGSKRYSYAIVRDFSNVGSVPAWFIEEATIAFMRAATIRGG